MMWMMMTAALAGEIEVTVRTDEGLKETVRMDDAATCERSSFTTRSEAGDMSIGWRVRPDGEAWLVSLDMEGKRRDDRSKLQELHLRPTLRLFDGKKGTFTVGSQGHELTVEVKVKGFTSEGCLDATRVSRQRRERRSSDSAEEQAE